MFKKIKQVYHRTDKYCVPMTILDDKAIAIASEIWNSPKNGPRQHPADFLVVREDDVCSLDPGGMYFKATKHIQFEIEGYSFDIQLSKIDDVLYYLETAKERVFGYRRFRLWMRNIILPNSIYEVLRQKLKELRMSDDALHAHITENEIKMQIERENPYVRFNIPREKG